MDRKFENLNSADESEKDSRWKIWYTYKHPKAMGLRYRVFKIISARISCLHGKPVVMLQPNQKKGPWNWVALTKKDAIQFHRNKVNLISTYTLDNSIELNAIM